MVSTAKPLEPVVVSTGSERLTRLGLNKYNPEPTEVRLGKLMAVNPALPILQLPPTVARPETALKSFKALSVSLKSPETLEIEDSPLTLFRLGLS